MSHTEDTQDETTVMLMELIQERITSGQWRIILVGKPPNRVEDELRREFDDLPNQIGIVVFERVS
jgi:hypothetical protein